MNELGHEFEDGRGACWVVVPELDGSLQDGHVGRISAGVGEGQFSDRPDHKQGSDQFDR